MKQGKFITLEGIDGAGKSHAAESIRSALEEAGVEVVMTREPGGTQVGEAVRNVFLDPSLDIGGDAEILLLFAARAQHLMDVVRPGLDAGKWIVCDRFTDSTYAYQGGGRQVPFERITLLENWVQGDLRPDLTIFLDVDVDTGRRRLGEGAELDRLDSEYGRTYNEFHMRVREAYLNLMKAHPRRIKLVDSNRSASEVASDARDLIVEYLRACEHADS